MKEDLAVQSFNFLLADKKTFFRGKLMLNICIVFSILCCLLFVVLLYPNVLIDAVFFDSAFFPDSLSKENIYYFFVVLFVAMCAYLSLLWFIYVSSRLHSPTSSPKPAFFILYIFYIIKSTLSITALILIISIMLFALIGGIYVSPAIKDILIPTSDLHFTLLLLFISYLLVSLLYPLAKLSFISSLKGKKRDKHLHTNGTVAYPVFNLIKSALFFLTVVVYFLFVDKLYSIGTHSLINLLPLFSILFLFLLHRLLIFILPLRYRRFANRNNRLIF